MAVSRTTWSKLNVWRVFVQLAVVNVAVAVWLVYAIVNHQGNQIWAAALLLVFLEFPLLIGLTISLRRARQKAAVPEPGTEPPRPAEHR